MHYLKNDYATSVNPCTGLAGGGQLHKQKQREGITGYNN
jgi:hypothetical protein